MAEASETGNEAALLVSGEEIAADSSASGQTALNLRPLFQMMADKGASDLFLAVNSPVRVKIEGKIYSINKNRISPDTMLAAAATIMSPEQQKALQEELELDFALSEPGVGRFRVNVFLQRGMPSIVMRYISRELPRIENLGLPENITDLLRHKRGLILVVGATGSGKSTTLAAMINFRNENFSEHILTIEDPIEFLHRNNKSIVSQREVGIDTRSFERALRGALRAAPDVVLIGEIRDRASMQAALTLAGTGQLVLATLHANNCAETLDRIINFFPHEQHDQAVMDLSQYLRAVISQRLVPGVNGKRVPAVEVMLNTAHISELIHKGDISAIKEALHVSTERGIQSFDQALLKLYKEGRVTLEAALSHADSRTNLESKINFG
jgi:twitching motility protein PilU